MQRPVVLGLILACAVSLSSSLEVLENGLPLRWAQTVSQVSELPVQNGVVTPDPWNFINRMSLFRLMIAATDPYMGTMGPNSTDSPLWGLPTQFAWFLSSGRLADPTSATTCGQTTGDTMCVSSQSFWGCVTYFTSAIPFLSAAKNQFMGTVTQVKMQVPEGATDFCTTYADCAARHPDVMSKWDEFFQGLKNSTSSPLPDNEKKDYILGLYWDAYMASIYASSVCNARQDYYSSAEKTFTNNWLESSDYVSASHYQSNLQNAVKLIAPLPSRILLDDNVAPNVADLSEEEKHTLTIFAWMKKINSLMGGTILRLWKASMCSITTREKGRELLEKLMLDPSFPLDTFMSLMTKMIATC